MIDDQAESWYNWMAEKWEDVTDEDLNQEFPAPRYPFQRSRSIILTHVISSVKPHSYVASGSSLASISSRSVQSPSQNSTSRLNR